MLSLMTRLNAPCCVLLRSGAYLRITWWHVIGATLQTFWEAFFMKRHIHNQARKRAPRDWEKLGWAYIGHFLWGAVVGWLCVHAHYMGEISSAVVALTLAFVFQKYERTEFFDIGDNVTRDTQDFNRGLIAVGLVAAVVYYFWR